jgi:hypothetical protein
MRHATLYAAFTLIMPLSATAQVYKCKDDTGATVVQQVPCRSSAPVVGDEIRAREAAHQRDRERAAEAAIQANVRFERERAQKIESDRQRKAAQDQNPAFNPAAVTKDCGTKDIPQGPLVGMTERRMFTCTWLGRANALVLENTTEVVGSVSRQYSDKLGILKYVYTRDGVVTGIQR